jgi:hypothetical protein
MPEQRQSTASDAPGLSRIVPTPAELRAQRGLLKVVAKLCALRARLWIIHQRLGEKPEDDDMGEARVPDSIRFSVRGAIECANDDHLETAIQTLQKAARETPETLAREWRERLAARGEGGGQA